ncbi:Phenylalanine--tRNA ligase beta subunit [Candidatus Desulfarcum epimagneticum]|uniref:Phenylalanine--tRNA ligase beta subunit n=1 Tax=uncultured Desulfobacteraceae bacterium TaxID=218296 RepID=A0A484HKS4_9BACT|nr:Phenylalanine--tRNA ligase beta subunit [uncultured Desulfobacteraceae bacterium]
MKISLSWLKAHVNVEMDPQSLAGALTMAGLEVETVSDRFAYLENVAAARILEILPMKGSDSLKLCRADLGDREASVVCGAPNVAEGMICPLALPGAALPGGTVKAARIRKETSEGMLCSAAELGISDDHSGVMPLGDDIAPGRRLSEILSLSDMVFDIDITPNRPDCLNVLGIAREVAAMENKPLLRPGADASGKEMETSVFDLAEVSIKDPDLCPRYAARVLEGVTVGPSPFWLKDRLLSVGMKPVNNIVDVTNFVMMEMGQPLHAFDLDRLAGHAIVVKTAGKNKSFVTLDGVERALPEDALMICDAEKPVAIAGIMGGMNSEIEPSTTRVLIESAYFSSAGVRKISKALGLSTEASYRFERGGDPGATAAALERAAVLMLETAGGRLAKGAIDEFPQPFAEKKLSLGAKETNRLLGTGFSANEMARLLESIDFKVEKEENGDLTVTAPSFRPDIGRPVDLMEEIARLSGYDDIPASFPAISGQISPPVKQLDVRTKIKGLMKGFGFFETIHYSFVSAESCDLLGLDENDRRRDFVKILNPLSTQQAVMRTTLLHGMFETAARNISRGSKNLRLFEIGKVFRVFPNAPDPKAPGKPGEETLPEETETLLCFQTGARWERSWTLKETPCDFYDMKGAAEGLFKGLGVGDAQFTALPESHCAYVKPGHAAAVSINGQYMGLLGEVSPGVLEKYGIPGPAFILEMNAHSLAGAVPDTLKTEPLPKFPSVSRDITLILDKGMETGRILEAIREFQEPLMEGARILDVFDKSPIPEGKASVTFRITYRSLERTLEDEEATRVNRKIADRIMDQFKADLPA